MTQMYIKTEYENDSLVISTVKSALLYSVTLRVNSNLNSELFRVGALFELYNELITHIFITRKKK